MPVSLLIALILAFGFDPSRADGPCHGRERAGAGDLRWDQPRGDPGVRARFVGGSRVSQTGIATSRLRKRYAIGVRLLTVLSLVVYGLIIHWVGWSRVVHTNWGLDDYILISNT